MKRIVWIAVCLTLSTSLWAGLNEDLFEAVKKGDKKKVVELIKKGADVNAKIKAPSYSEGWTPLHFAAQWGDMEIIRLLISKKADVNALSKGLAPLRPLHASAYSGHYKASQFLLANGANVDALDGYGRTPLHGVAYGKNIKIAKLLIEKGANVNAKVPSGELKGKTPLDLAKSHEMKKFLRKAGGKKGKL